jgi:hypothetical protein
MPSTTAAPLVEQEHVEADTAISAHESAARVEPRLVSSASDRTGQAQRPGRLTRAFVASAPWLMRAVALSTVAVIVFLVVSAYLPAD